MGLSEEIERQLCEPLEKFGVKKLKSFQEKCIQRIMDDKKDVFCISKTGSGKSLCYQLPALLLDGYTVVISPLTALIDDQIRSLADKDISAAGFYHDSNKNDKEQQEALLNGQGELMGQNVGTNRAVKPLLDFRNYIKVNDGVKRYNKRISQKELSERADVSLTTLRVLLKGDNINAECAKRICSVLDLRYQFAFEEIDRGRIKASTVKRYHALISSICTFAVYQNIIMVNPCTRVKPPRVCKKEAEYLDEEETNKLLNALQTTAEPFRTAVQLLLFTGMRRGELCGLEWQDVDFDNGILRVCRTLLYTSETGVFEDTPKNYSSVRSIRISEYVVELLRQYKKWQEEQSKRLGTKWIGSTKIFTNEFGAPLHPSTMTRWFANFNEKNGLKKIPLHSLRHTSATLLIMSGVPVNVVSKRLGHNDTSTTMSIYTHVLRSADALAAEALDNVILFKVKDKKNETASD